MQPNVSPSPTPVPTPETRSRGWGYWVVILGGLAVALGTVVTQQTSFDILNLSGAPPSLPLGTYQEWAILSGTGTLLVCGRLSVGLRRGLRGVPGFTVGSGWTDPPDVRDPPSRRFARSCWARGIERARVLLLARRSLPGLTVYYSIDLGGRIVEAVGFFVAFVGVAGALRR